VRRRDSNLPGRDKGSDADEGDEPFQTEGVYFSSSDQGLGAFRPADRR
jgi:hypothetical protein